MNKKIIITIVLLLMATVNFGQTFNKNDRIKIRVDSIRSKYDCFISDANVHRVAFLTFNKKILLFRNIYGFTDVLEKIPFQRSSKMYAAVFEKNAFCLSCNT